MSVTKEKNERKEIKRFGTIIGLALLFIGTLLSILGKGGSQYFLYIGAFFVFMGIYFQSVLKPVYHVWMKFGQLMGWITSRIILFLLFYLVVTPIGLIGRLFGKEFLQIKIDHNEKSYWEERGNITAEKDSLEKQF